MRVSLYLKLLFLKGNQIKSFLSEDQDVLALVWTRNKEIYIINQIYMFFNVFLRKQEQEQEQEQEKDQE